MPEHQCTLPAEGWPGDAYTCPECGTEYVALDLEGDADMIEWVDGTDD